MNVCLRCRATYLRAWLLQKHMFHVVLTLDSGGRCIWDVENALQIEMVQPKPKLTRQMQVDTHVLEHWSTDNVNGRL